MQIPVKPPAARRLVAPRLTPHVQPPKPFAAVVAEVPREPARTTLAPPKVERENEPPAKKRERPPVDALDPTARNPALVAPPVPVAPATVEAAESPRARMSMEELLPALVRRIAWAGDRHKGIVRIELGAGAYAGTTMLVHADGGRVRVELSGAGDLEPLRMKLDERLRSHGLDVESVA